MKKLWLQLGDRFDALQPRERLLVFLALVALLAGLFVFLLLNPALARYQAARKVVQQSEKSLQGFAEQEVLLIEGSSRDPDLAERAALAAQARELDELRRTLLGGEHGLMSPELMSERLRALIAARKGLELVSIQSGEAQDLLAGPGNSPGTRPLRSLYRHSMKLVLRGEYPALHAYLREVEALPGQLSTSELRLRSEAWPQASLTLTLKFNSLERAWLAF